MSDFTEPMYWGGTNCVKPENVAESGYVAGDNPAAEHENYFRHQTYLCLKELQDAITEVNGHLSYIDSRLNAYEDRIEALESSSKTLSNKLTSYLTNTANKITFLSDDSGFYYLDEDGEKLTGEQEINGIPYSFYDDDSNAPGTLRTGWVDVFGKRYYYNPGDGNIALGWVSYQGNNYYVTLMEGKLVNQYKTIDNVYYHFDENGVASEV